MKYFRLAAALFIISGIILLTFSCSSNSGASSSSSPLTQIATVQKGSIMISVTGTGNLALSRKEDLAFDMAGTVEEVLVKEGDSIKEGQTLVSLDTSEWDKQVKNLEQALSAAESAISSRENELEKAERALAARERDLLKAQNNVGARERDVVKAERKVSAAESQVIAREYALRQAELNLEKAELAYQNFATHTETDEVEKELKKLQIEIARTAIDDARAAIEDARLAVADASQGIIDAGLAKEDAGQAVKDAELNIEDAKKAIEDAKKRVEDARVDHADAQNALDEARALSPTIKAPFDGFVAKISVKGGDEAKKGTVAIQIADPAQFEANILVTEQDISSIKLDGAASVSLDALSGLTFPAKITAIAPLATIQQGVVNYKVTVQLTSLRPGAGENVFSRQWQSGTDGTPAAPTGSPRAPGGAQSPNVVPGSPPAEITPGETMTGVSLKDGMSAMVTIVVLKKDNILVVPNRAITRQGQNNTVQIVKGAGTETRTVKVGINDNQNTEITDGLTEGEQVVITTSTSSTTARTQMPGMGGIRLP